MHRRSTITVSLSLEKWMILKEMDECGVASWEQMAEMEER
jgi:hypothetical protein